MNKVSSSTQTGRSVVRQPGGPESIEWEIIDLPAPQPGEVQLAHEAIGVDFIDTQIRSGGMQVPLPTGLGFSGAGRVLAVGSEVKGLQAGDLVAYSNSVAGAYSEQRNVPAGRVFRLPDQQMSAVTAAGALFRGLTAWYLAKRLRKIEPGEFVLVHAAAGGVGLILTQWLAHLGAQVIGVVRGEHKRELALKNGCKHVIDQQQESFAERVADITAGKGVSIVYDSVGKDTFEDSLRSLQRFGLMVSYGWASGDVDPVALPHLRNLGSLFITRPTVSHYTAEAADFQEGAAELFALVDKGVIQITVGQTYPLREAGRAHADLVGRATVGSTVLVP